MKIFARIYVDFRDHPKAIAAGAVARDLWVWGILYCRDHELDGIIPRKAVIDSMWGAGPRRKRNLKVATKLVAVGLWRDHFGDYEVVNYVTKNDTKDVIENNKTAQNSRKQKSRAEKGHTDVTAHRDRDRDSNIKEPPNPQWGNVVDSVSEDPKPDLTLSESTPREQEYQGAYEAGVCAGKGGGYHMPSNQRGDLHGAILAHGRGGKSGRVFRGAELLEWITLSTTDFVTEVKDNNPQFYSSFGPRGWLKWLNERVRANDSRNIP